MDYNNIISCINTNKYTEEEYENIINICNKKTNELTNEYYSNKIYKINNDLIKSFLKFNFYKKMSDSLISYNIKFNYDLFIITLSHRKSFCSEFGGFDMENRINIIDTHNEQCYNLYGTKMISKFINLLNLDISEENIRDLLNKIFSIYQPTELIKW